MSMGLQASTSEPPRKTEVVVERMRDGDWTGALRIAHTFKRRMTCQQRKALKRAHEITDPNKAQMYQQMGYKISEVFDRGVEVLLELYGDRL